MWTEYRANVEAEIGQGDADVLVNVEFTVRERGNDEDGYEREFDGPFVVTDVDKYYGTHTRDYDEMSDSNQARIDFAMRQYCESKS